MPTDLTVVLTDEPGQLAKLGGATGEAGVNIELLYTTFGGIKVAIATDDLESARAALA